jgi:hypothetical protein
VRSSRTLGAAFAVVAALSFAGGAAASSSTVVVRPGDVAAGTLPAAGGQTWSTAGTHSGGAVSLTTGPATAPLGAGSAKMTTDSDPARGSLLTNNYVGIVLATIDTLSYSAYRSSISTNNEAQAIALTLLVDYNGPDVAGGSTTLIFEPVYQPGGVGAMKTDTWQTWDALQGGKAIWWSTTDMPNPVGPGFIACNPNVAIVPAGCADKLFVSLSSILDAYPSATIRSGVNGGLGLAVGSGWAGAFTGYADALKIGVSGNATTYDFEPKSSLSVKAPDASRVQGNANPTFVPSYAGFVFGDTAANLTTQPTCTTTATADSPVGTYPIVCAGGVSANYDIAYVPGTLGVIAGVTATPTVEPTQVAGGVTGTPTLEPSQRLAGATGIPVSAATPPATSATFGSEGGRDATPLLALLICAAFGSLGLLVVAAQRRGSRR